MTYHAGRPLAFVFVAAAFAVTMLGTTLPTPLYPLYEAKYGFGGLVVTIVFSVYAVGVAVGLLLFGQLSDQIGRRRTLLPGLALSAASALVFLTHGGLASLLIGRVLSGLSAGIFTGTATATLIDLVPEDRRPRASLVAAAANMGGLGLGPVVAGVLAQYAPWPLTLCFLVDLGLVGVVAAGIWSIPEPVQTSGRARLRVQRLRVPAELRGTFIRAAIAGFAGFAVLGLFTAVSPSALVEVLHDTNHALTGGVVVSLFAASTAGQVLAGRLAERQAMLSGCVGLALGIAIVAASLPTASLALLVIGAVVAGFGQGLCFRAGLGAVTAATPPEQRSEVASSFFVVLYVGITLPVVGLGAAAQAFGLVAAGVVFAAGVALLALVAFAALLQQASTADTH